MRDSPWFKTELLLSAPVTLVRYDPQSPTRDPEPPYLLPCVLSHYSLLLVLVFCGGFFLFCSFSFFFLSFFLSCLHSARLSRDAPFFLGGGVRSQQASIVAGSSGWKYYYPLIGSDISSTYLIVHRDRILITTDCTYIDVCFHTISTWFNHPYSHTSFHSRFLRTENH